MATKYSSFTPEDIARLKRIIAMHPNKNIKWDIWAGQFDHPLGSVKVMASRLRDQMGKERMRGFNRAMRALRDRDPPRPPAPAPAEERRLVPRVIELDGHRINTSTQGMQFAAEMLVRIGTQGITGGLLGDPPPGRSALDKKRAGIVEPIHRDRRKDRDAEWNAIMWRMERKRTPRHATDKPAARVLTAAAPGTP